MQTSVVHNLKLLVLAGAEITITHLKSVSFLYLSLFPGQAFTLDLPRNIPNIFFSCHPSESAIMAHSKQFLLGLSTAQPHEIPTPGSILWFSHPSYLLPTAFASIHSFFTFTFQPCHNPGRGSIVFNASINSKVGHPGLVLVYYIVTIIVDLLAHFKLWGRMAYV